MVPQRLPHLAMTLVGLSLFQFHESQQIHPLPPDHSPSLYWSPRLELFQLLTFIVYSSFLIFATLSPFVFESGEKPVWRACSENSHRDVYGTWLPKAPSFHTLGSKRNQHHYYHLINGRTKVKRGLVCAPETSGRRQAGCSERPSSQSCPSGSSRERRASGQGDSSSCCPGAGLASGLHSGHIVRWAGVTKAQVWLQKQVPLATGRFYPGLAKPVELQSKE